MDGDFDMIEAKIRDAINNGKLTKQSIERGAWALINVEICRDDQPANEKLIEQCENLLNTLNRAEATSEPDIEKSLQGAKLKLAEHCKTERRIKEMKTVQRVAWRAALFAMIFMLLIGGVGVMSYKYWLGGFSTTDEQQYVIQGYEIDPHIISQGIAEHNREAMLQTDNWDEIVNFLGFTPNVPNSISSTWYADDYVAFVNSEWIYVTTFYVDQDKSEASALILDIYFFADIDEAHISFEQSRLGVETDLHGNTTYISENIDNSFACWINGNVVYNISGNVSTDEICQVALEIIGGFR